MVHYKVSNDSRIGASLKVQFESYSDMTYYSIHFWVSYGLKKSGGSLLNVVLSIVKSSFVTLITTRTRIRVLTAPRPNGNYLRPKAVTITT